MPTTPCTKPRVLRSVPRAFIAASALLSGASGAWAQAPGDVVVSQIWGGTSGSSGSASLPKADFVELHNRTGSPIALTGWSIAVASSATTTTWEYVDLAGSIAANGYYLVRVSVETTNGVALPPADAIGAASTSRLGSSSGKVVLRTVGSSTTITGNCPAIDATIIDRVVYGSNDTCSEFASAPAMSTSGSGMSIYRAEGGCGDTGNNSADFSQGAIAARNTSSPAGSACVIGSCCPALGGYCVITTASSCASVNGVFTLAGSCDPLPCVSGTCCDINTGECFIATQAACVSMNGSYAGDGTTCGSVQCAPVGACCTGTTGTTCSILTAAGCAAADGFYQSNGTTCSPTPCRTSSCCLPNGSCCNMLSDMCISMGGTAGAFLSSCTASTTCVPLPANDLCANAIPLTAGVTATGNNFTALTNDGLNPVCASQQVSRGVWFTFTPPPGGGVYDIGSCGSIFNALLGVYTIGDCNDISTWNYVACDESSCGFSNPTPFCNFSSGTAQAAKITGLYLEGGVTYHILLGTDGPTLSGNNYALTLTNVGAVPVGACCNPITGVCTVMTQAGCEASGPSTSGLTPVYIGDGSTCPDGPCAFVGACCLAGGVCTIRAEGACNPPEAFQLGVTCATAPCAPPTNDECMNATPMQLDTFFSGNTVGSTVSTVASLCSSNDLDIYYVFTPSKTAVYRFLIVPTFGTFNMSIGTSCSPFDDNILCTSNTSTQFSGDPTLDAGVPYYIRLAVGFGTSNHGVFAAFGVVCASDCCPADFNGVNGVSVQDIFDFLTAWLAGNTSADFNHVNGVTVQDIFDFLTAWLAGC